MIRLFLLLVTSFLVFEFISPMVLYIFVGLPETRSAQCLFIGNMYLLTVHWIIQADKYLAKRFKHTH